MKINLQNHTQHKLSLVLTLKNVFDKKYSCLDCNKEDQLRLCYKHGKQNILCAKPHQDRRAQH